MLCGICLYSITDKRLLRTVMDNLLKNGQPVENRRFLSRPGLAFAERQWQA
jgi:hypothetical protein